MFKKSSILLYMILFYCTFNNNATALQDTSDYAISPKENAISESPKIAKNKTIQKTTKKKNTKKTPPKQEVDQTETLFSVKGAIKDVGHGIKDTAKKVGGVAKKGAEKTADLAKKAAKEAKKAGKKGVDIAKQGAKEVKKGVKKVFTMSVDFAKKVPWTTVFTEGLKIAVPALKGCVKSGIAAAVPAIMAGPETLGLGTVGTLAGACAIGGAKSSIPAILGVTKNVFDSWSNKKKADEIQKQIDLNQQDANAVNNSIGQANKAKASLKSKDEKDAADVAITKAKGTKSTIDGFVGQLKAEQKKYK
ncbi:MAG: hypothetical protein Q8L85_03915 [Alphaproteobacteria bacterium]|nr:hypothetical protein [Alphaproteobacteria bacterium]